MIVRMYLEKRSSTSQFVRLRGQRHHVRSWGQPDPNQPVLVMVHGWMDVAASFQFVVDALLAERFVIAPDWRGYGLTESGGADNYWFPDYMADLDFLLDHFSPTRPVDLLGHSLGGNVATLYAGVRPQRVRRLVNLEGFGVAATEPGEAPARYARWMDELKALHRGDLALRAYDEQSGVARRLMRTNKRLSQDKADWLAGHWSRRNADGKWEILGAAAHKVVNAHLTRLDETLEIYKRIAAPMLFVEASRNQLEQWYRGKFTLAEFHQRLAHVPQVSKALVQDAGHMLHHDQPEQLAALIEDFLA
jgi:pimeloyl-ACP methyl ester carboxylesterase